MGKIDSQSQARMDGMAYALKIAKERGIDGLENDIKARGILGVNLSVSDKEFQEAFEKNVYHAFLEYENSNATGAG